MEERRLEDRIFKFAISVAKFVAALPPQGVYSVIYRQLLRSALSVGANWQEAAGGLTNADFTHSANIAKKEAMETSYWLKVMAELEIGNPKDLTPLCVEASELVSILIAIVKKVRSRGNIKISKVVLPLLLSLILNPWSLILSHAADWPMFRGNARRTGFTSEQIYPPLTKAWEYQTGAGILSSPAVFEDVVYFGSRDNNIYALNARTGALLWQYAADNWVDASPTVSGDMVYCPSMDGHLYALDRLTGALLWKAALGASSVSSPLVLNGKVLVGTGSPENKLKVFDAASGSLLFESPADQPVDSAPSADASRVYFGANDGTLYALDMNTFSSTWSYQTMGGRYGMNAVAVSSGIIYALPGYDEHKPLALNAPDGTLLNPLSKDFDSHTAWEQVGSPVVSKDRVYFPGGYSVDWPPEEGNILYAMDKQVSDQELPYVWPSSPTLGGISGLGTLSSPAMANELIYIGTIDGELAAFSSAAAAVPLTAAVSFSTPVYSSPALSNGMVFVGTAGGKMVAYRASRTAAISGPKNEAVVSGTVSINGYFANPGLTGYTLEYGQGESPASWQNIISSVIAVGAENVTLALWDTSALPNGDYTLRLSVLENPVSGSDCTALLAVRVNAPPLPPSGLSAADVPGDTGNSIRLNWTASPTGGVSYRIYRDNGGGYAELASVAAGVLTYTDAAAPTGMTFTYVVRAFDGYAESADSAAATASSVNNSGDVTAPDAITDLAATQGAAPGSVRLTFTATGNDGNLGTASHYVIKYTTVPGYNWTNFEGAVLQSVVWPAEGPAGDNFSKELGGLYGGVTYYFAVKTADFIPNFSGVSNSTDAWASIDTVPPLPPAGLSVADTLGDDGNSLTLEWTLSPDDGALAGDVYGYKIYRRQQGAAYVPDDPYATVAKGVKSYIDTAATTNIRFYYSAAAFDSTNNSPLSNEANGISADNWRFFDSSQGGAVRLPDGARVVIPEGAASQNDDIMFLKLDPVTFQPLAGVKANTGVRSTGLVYEIKFKKAGTNLLKPATLTLPYTDADVAGMNQENLRLYTLSAGVWQLVNTSKPDTNAKTVTAEVNHFSVYSIMEYVPSGDLLNKDEVYSYPNPARSDTLTFKFRTAYKSNVTIDVYNIAGEKVARLEKSDCPAGLTSEIVWNIRRIASGVYQYKVEAESAAGSKFLIKRLAIIH